MSREVDERIVRLEFENKGFEKKAKQSSSTLEKLKARMDFRREAKSMDNAFDDRRFNVFVKGLDKVKASFSAFEAVAFSTINNLTNRMVDAGIKIAKSMSIDNVAGAWESYNSINETKAALTAQGQEAEKVSKAMDKLKWFSDETSYSLKGLTSSMNNFISTGRTMEESIDIVMGIAGAAAMASQKPEKAFAVLNQLYQDAGRYITTGTWNQSVAGAGLNVDQFKQKILEAAVDVGTLVRLLDGRLVASNGKEVNLKNFQNVLSDTGFFTGEVLARVGQIYAAGANEIYEIVANSGKLTYEVMKELGQRMDNDFSLIVFGMLQKTRSLEQAIEATKIAVQGNWIKLFGIIFGNENESTELWSNLAERMIEFAAGPYEKWIDLLTEWKKLGGREDLFGEGGALWNLIDAFEKLRDVIRDAFNEVFHIQPNLKAFTEWLKDFTSNLILSDEAAENLKTIFKGLFSVVRIVGKLFSVVWSLIQVVWPYVQKVIDFIVNILVKVSDALYTVAEGDAKTPLEKYINGLKNFFLGLWQAIQTMAPVIGQMFEWLGDVFTQLGDTLKKIFSGEQGLFEVKDLLTITIWAALIAFFWWMASGWISWGQTLKEFVQSFGDLLDSLAMHFKAKAMKTFVTSILMLVAAIAIIGSMDPQVIIRGTIIVGLVWYALRLTMDQLNNGQWANVKKYTSMMSSLLMLAVIVASFVGIIKLVEMSGINFGHVMLTALITFGVGIALNDLAWISRNAKIDINNIAKIAGAVMLIEVAIASFIGLLIIAKHADVSAREFGIIGGIFAGLLGVTIVLGKLGQSGLIDAKGVAGVVASLFLFEIALAGFVGLMLLFKHADISTESLNNFMKACTALLGITLIMSAIAYVFGSNAGYMLAGIGILALLGPAMISFSLGIAVLGGTIAVLATILSLIGKLDFTTFLKGAGILLLTAVTITVAVGILTAATSLLVLLGVGIFIFAATFAGAVGLIVLAITSLGVSLASFALLISGLKNGLESLDEIDFGKVTRGIFKLIGVVLLLGAASIIMLPAALTIGVFALSLSLLTLALAPLVLLLDKLGGQIGDKQKMKDNLDNILDVVSTFILKLIETLGNMAIEFGGMLFNMTAGAIDVLIEKGPMLIEKVVMLFVTLVQGLSDAIHNNNPAIVKSITSLFGALIDLILKFFGVDSDFYDEFGSLGEGLGDVFGAALMHGLFPAAAYIMDLFNMVKGIIGFVQGDSSTPKSTQEAVMYGTTPYTPGEFSPVLSAMDAGLNGSAMLPFVQPSPLTYDDSFIGPRAPYSWYVENMEVVANDPEELARQMQSQANRSRKTFGDQPLIAAQR